MPEAKQADVIKTVIDMRSAGATDEEIMKTLKELGVAEDQILRIMGIAQRDILVTLRGEFARLVSEEFERRKPEIQDFMKKRAENESEEKAKRIVKDLDAKLEDRDVQVQKKLDFYSASVKKEEERLAALGMDVKNLRADIVHLTFGGTAVRRLFSFLFLFLGLAMILYLFYNYFEKGYIATQIIGKSIAEAMPLLIPLVAFVVAGVSMMIVAMHIKGG